MTRWKKLILLISPREYHAVRMDKLAMLMEQAVPAEQEPVSSNYKWFASSLFGIRKLFPES